MAATEVLFLLDGQGLPLDHAGADAVGAFAGLAPVGTEPEAGVFEGLALGVGVDAIEDHPAGIGEQYRVVVAGKLLVEAVHLAIGDLQHLLQALAAFEHARVLQHHRRHRLAGIEMVLFQAAQPGAGDGRIGRRPPGGILPWATVSTCRAWRLMELAGIVMVLREGRAVSCLGAVDRSATLRTAIGAASNRPGRNATTD